MDSSFSGRRLRGQSFLIAVLLIGWSLSAMGAFWMLEARYLLPVSRPTGAATPSTGSPAPLHELGLASLDFLRSGKITVLNFWNPDCPCSRFMEPHVQDLIHRFGPVGVRFVTVVEPNVGVSKHEALDRWNERGVNGSECVYDDDDHLARAMGVWAAPAAVISDSKGVIRFVGAYNVARFCDASDTAFAEKALAAVVKGVNPQIAKTPFYGCRVLDGKYECSTARRD